ncbi:hypothetical protein M9H77_16845 [Catharanthus roseus]|uniref:Uncharacterized protein n=1 Tax=Catharanthus roseus TaxID=4058 RepID=A0ACC0B2X0_CATRO|nr:hypothetical protein M9H77_16845 [Catharanthus roseus]
MNLLKFERNSPIASRFLYLLRLDCQGFVNVEKAWINLGISYDIYLNMEDEFHHLSCLAKGVNDFKREEETNYEQSSGRYLGGQMHDNQWGYGNFSPHARSYDHNFYDCYEANRFGTRNDYNDTSCKRIPRNDARNGGNYVNMYKRFHKRQGDYDGYYEIYNYGGYNCRRSSQTLGTISKPLSYNNLKLPLLRGTFGPYDYETWEQKVESLFYSYCEREEEKFQLVTKSLPYEVKVWVGF